MQDVLSIQSVTGVDLNLRIAGPGARSYAFVIDWHIRLLAALIWMLVGILIVSGSLADFDPADGGAAFVFAVVLPTAAIYFLYHPVLEVLMSGRTPGKRIAGVRVVKPDGAIPGIGALLIRNIFRLIDSLPVAYCVGLGTALVTKQSVRFGDMAAGTLLVYDEPEAKGFDELPVTASGRLSLEQIELIRDLLDRWDGLDFLTRRQLAQALLEKFGEQPDSRADAALRSALTKLLASSHVPS
ncbi:MAG: RDD family protein [Gammaproteobacteria bacterium]|nr:RDD family protein [Gammaproteobacteria bacterium]